jgi:hypothetical protein
LVLISVRGFIDRRATVDNLVCDNGYTQVVSGPTRGDALLDIYLIKPESLLISCNILSGISDHNGVLLEVEWDEICREPQVERIVPLYHKTDVLGLQAFLREKFKLWAGNGSCVEEIWNSYKDIILEGVKRYVPNKTLSKNPDPEYYNREVKRLKVKVREVYSKRKFGQHYQAALKRLSKELLAAKRLLRRHFYVRSYKTRVVAGQSSINVLKDVKEVEKIFRRSKTKMASSSQSQ